MTELSIHHERIRRRGVNLPVLWLARAILQPAMQLYFLLARGGRHNIPAEGAVILAANHRSFLDPFAIASCLGRPVYFVAKRELFEPRWQGWLLNALGAFPVRRGEADEEMMETARTVLERGDPVLIFLEGKRVRSGPLGRPKRGAGRLALETGAPIVPIAVTGTERARNGWLIRPCRVRIRCGTPLRFPRAADPSPMLAGAVVDRVWACVELQWGWLGGPLPARPPRPPAGALVAGRGG